MESSDPQHLALLLNVSNILNSSLSLEDVLENLGPALPLLGIPAARLLEARLGRRLRLVMNTSAKDSISGNGTLMKVVFQVKGQSGQQCDLRLEQVQAWDNTAPEAPPYEMPVDVEPGKFSVGGGGLSIVLLAGIGLLLVLILVVWLAKRKPGPVAAACSGCGAALEPGTRFCSHCGQPAA